MSSPLGQSDTNMIENISFGQYSLRIDIFDSVNVIDEFPAEDLPGFRKIYPRCFH